VLARFAPLGGQWFLSFFRMGRAGEVVYCRSAEWVGKVGRMPSVYIKTYGCQMNERDSEAVAAQLVAKGYTLAGAEAAADVILLNTCSVRDMAEQRALRKMENIAADVRKNR